MEQQRRFAHPRRSSQRGESTPFAQTVPHGCQGLAVRAAHIQKAGIRSSTERLLAQLVIIDKHLRFPLAGSGAFRPRWPRRREDGSKAKSLEAKLVMMRGNDK